MTSDKSECDEVYYYELILVPSRLIINTDLIVHRISLGSRGAVLRNIDPNPGLPTDAHHLSELIP